MPRDERKPFTLRLDQSTMDALRTVAKLERRTMNRVLEELVEQGLPARIARIETDLASTLEQVRALKPGAPASDER